MEGIPWPAVTAASGGWLLAFAFLYMVFSGKVYAATQVDREMARAALALEKAEHDRDEWRTESRIKDAQISEQAKQLGYMAEVGEMQKAVLTSLQKLEEGAR